MASKDQTDLSRSINSNDILKVQEILKQGGIVNCTYENDNTPLHQAIANGFVNIVQILLDHGANVNSEGSELQTPLHLAASTGNIKLVETLLAVGAELEKRNQQGETPLMVALKNNKVPTSTMLLERGAKASTKDVKNLTPLHWAANFGMKEVVQKLMDQSAEINSLDINGWTPLTEATCNGRINIMETLIQNRAEVNIQDKKGWTALHYAAANDQEDALKTLLRFNADVHITDISRETALQKAFTNDKVRSVKILLNHGSSISETDDQGRTPLHRACNSRNSDVISILLKKGADCNLQDNYEWTPLQYAVRCGKSDFVQKLLEHGANVNKQDAIGFTPLHRAVVYGNEELVQVLLSNGASANQLDNQGWTPVHHVAENGTVTVLNALLESSASVDAVDIKGYTPLHIAAKKGNVVVLTELLIHGADTNLCTKITGFTALHFAAKSGNTSTVAELLMHGADLNLYTSITKQTPCDIAEEENHDKVIKVFKEHVADGLPLEVKLLNSKVSDEFERSLASGFYYSYVGKVMIVGNESVGKTAITRLLLGKKPQKRRKPTEGIRIHRSRLAIDRQTRKLVSKGLEFEDMAYSNLFMTKRDSIQNIPKELSTAERDTDAFLTRSECSLDQDKSSICYSIPELDEHEDREFVSSGMEIKSDVKNKNFSWREKLQSTFRMQQKQKQKVSSKNKLRRGAKRASMKGVHKRKLAPVILLDFAGQEVFYSTHQSFLTHRGVYVIVINGSLMLDEEIVTETFIPGRQGKPTTRGYVKFWISSILSYAKGRSQSFPRIIVCCTHKDKIPKENVETQRKYIFDEIENMFEGSPSSPHLVLKERIFLNALDRADPELEVLKDVIVEMMYKQPTWGEKMPKAWIQLEMEIHDVAKEGTQIITLEQLEKMNQKNPVKSLGEEEINLFLQVHHSLGNIIHFPFIGLREYILISPSYLIDALRCIVTDKQFCKAEKLKSWTELSRFGVLEKYDVLKIMQKHKEFKRHQDFLIKLMCHLDILVEPRNYLIDGQYDSSKNYFVPCMITKQYIGTQFFQHENTKDKSINLSFKFNTTILPPAVGFRLIACCLNIWNVKTYSNKPLLCSGIVVVTINRSLCLTVRVKEQRIDIMLTHNTSRFNIISQVASSIRECLQDCLRGISNSYKASSFGTLDDQSEMFHTEFSCYDLNDPCYYKESKNLICSHGYNIEQDITNKWFSNKQSEDCGPDCKGVSIEALKQRPTDLHLAKLSSQITWSDLRPILVHLGLEERERLTIEEDYPGHNVNIRFLCLRKWNKKTLNPKLEDIQIALLHENQNPHVLCHIFRDSNMKTNLSPTRMETEPTDLDIDKIATHAIEESLMLCVNLSIDVNEWLQMKDSNGKIVDINRTILHKWKKEHPGKPKLKELAQALSNVSINIDYVLDNNVT